MDTTPQIYPDTHLFDVEKVQLTISPTIKDRDGNDQPYSGPPPTWTSSAPDQVGLEVAADGLSAFALTPLDAGEATITIEAPGIRTAQMKIIYAPQEPGSFNLSAGTPVPDA